MTASPDDVFTADEAAAHLKMTRRAVITTGKRYGLCFIHGRTVRFTRRQLTELVEAMRHKPASSIGQRYSAAAKHGLALERSLVALTKQNAQREAAKLARRQKQAAEREARLIEKRRIAQEKRDARATRAAEKKAHSKPKDVPLDRHCRDSEYWTPERKRRLKLERERP